MTDLELIVDRVVSKPVRYLDLHDRVVLCLFKLFFWLGFLVVLVFIVNVFGGPTVILIL